MRKLTIILVGIGLAGCGGGGSSSEDQVRSTVSDFQKAIVGHDSQAYCNLLTSSFRQLTASASYGGCKAPGGITNIGSESIQTVAVSGSTANVALTGGATVKLKQENGDWKVADWKNPQTP